MIKNSYKIALLTLMIIGVSACAQEPNTAEKIRSFSTANEAQAKINNDLASSWEEGNTMLSRGKDKVKRGEKMIDRAEKDIKKGKKMIRDGEEEISQGRKLTGESQAYFEERYNVAR